MEKGTCIYKELIDIAKGKTSKDKLNSIAEFVYQKYNVKINFCQIFGNRWSFYAGSIDLITVQARIKLTDKIGIFIEDNNLDEHVWNELLSDIKKVI
ncbi:hypothetical protein JYG23_02290 [Sedimentibacter sp. zth1]|uniref:hypothetical protein n=1 Tax=Sedimentibacter sp. zth1 TaxID=2816908 RepID=UPI001A922F40|nr:hypothetical protein [Sedimentibacter sp. zth1]QSX06310.1 hypothetical protein JYG23_02290 [Sedimentibacter sp. zth1]